MIDDDNDFGEPDGFEAPATVALAPIIPFNRFKPNPAVIEAWARERAREEKPYKFASPLDALDEMERRRGLPAMPVDPRWTDFAKRAVLYPGEMMGIAGPTGGGKTSFALQIMRAGMGNGLPALWLPLELDAPQLNLRLVANVTQIHMMVIRDEWKRSAIERELMPFVDRWRYVDRVRGVMEQIRALRTAIRMARRIYDRPPIYCIDYIGKLARGSGKEARAELADGIEALREMTIEEECYGLLLSQTSRGNQAAVTGKMDLESATDAIGVSAETGELEHAVAVNVALNVFKRDDAQTLDSHVLVTKARNSGREGRVGFTFGKPGGFWTELDHLPPTPSEVKAEAAKQKKTGTTIDAGSPIKARADLNEARAAEANAKRERALLGALMKAGLFGLGMRELRAVRGCGNQKRTVASLQELAKRGDVEEMVKGKWRVIPK
jgi:KaiC/GvpD/RAD55 family RecA-like ATPase